MTVWGEGVFLLNAALDYALLAGAVRLQGGVRTRRLLWAALLGGLLAVLALYPLPLVRGIPGRILGFCLLTGCAFGLSLQALRLGIVFLMLSLALCGIQTALAELLSCGAVVWRGGVLVMISWRSLLASAALLYGACAALSGAIRSRKRLLLRVQVTAGGRTMSFRGLSDTGSFLRDPLTGRPVVLADSSIAFSLLGLRPEQLRRPAELLPELTAQRPELHPRLIPYSAVGTERGLLLGIKCQDLWVGSQQRDGGILAFSPHEVSDDGSYHGLTGG